jgi:hypothetical protein
MSRIENPRVINGLRDHIGNPEWNGREGPRFYPLGL